jgi:hypothetical protein
MHTCSFELQKEFCCTNFAQSVRRHIEDLAFLVPTLDFAAVALKIFGLARLGKVCNKNSQIYLRVRHDYLSIIPHCVNRVDGITWFLPVRDSQRAPKWCRDISCEYAMISQNLVDSTKIVCIVVCAMINV